MKCFFSNRNKYEISGDAHVPDFCQHNYGAKKSENNSFNSPKSICLIEPMFSLSFLDHLFSIFWYQTSYETLIKLLPIFLRNFSSNRMLQSHFCLDISIISGISRGLTSFGHPFWGEILRRRYFEIPS